LRIGGKSVARRSFEVVEERSGEPETEEAIRVDRLVALGRALSDPIRVRMLGMMAEGRSCCDLPDLGAPVDEGSPGICVCEFEDYFGMGQSKVSYHVRKLKEAGLVREEKRGKWSFYSLDGEAAGDLLGNVAAHLSFGSSGWREDGRC
jgi:ArsR family transcriptional regulator, arsenate/arsenite/antimonite-responsive transcriptional repressor